MEASGRAIASWIGTLSSGGVIRTPEQDAGVTLACFVLGEDHLAALREWMVSQPREEIVDAQRAAIEVCCWIAAADRRLDPAEVELLEQIILSSELPTAVQDELRGTITDPPAPRDVEVRLAHPVLREMLIALSWELAEADGRLDAREAEFLADIGGRLGVPEARSAELHDALLSRVGALP